MGFMLSDKVFHISDLVTILPQKHLRKDLHGKTGIIVAMVGDTFPFMYTIRIDNTEEYNRGYSEYNFMGNEIELLTIVD